MKKLFLLFALVGMFATACVDDGNGKTPDDAYIALNKENITFAPDGGSLDIKVYSNYEWTLTNNCDWVTTSATSGEANEEGTTVTLTADEASNGREGTIIFSCGKAKKALVVSQSFKATIIADDNNTFNVPADGGTVELTYQTNVECEVIIPEEAQSWISLADDTRGLVSESVVLNIAPNNSGAEKSAIIKVVKVEDTSISTEYIITQERNMDCIIEYTSANDSIVTPNNSSAFGATILRNEYIDGKGYIEFDAPVTSIRYHAFYYCTSLTSITIPDSVTEIGERAFSDCYSLTSVTIPDSVTEIGDYAFYDCESLTSVTIGNSVTEIGDTAFYDCTSLTNVTIPDSVTEIGEWAFSHCTSLTSVTIGNSVTEIGNYSFRDCSSLTSVTIPDSVTSIGELAFQECTSLTSFYGKFASVDSRCLIANGKLIAFAIGCGATEYTIPDSVTEIGNSAFRSCYSLTSVIIPDSVTSIGDYAFYDCTSLASVTIGNSVTKIGNYAFSHCSSLTSVTIPGSVTEIGKWAFVGCTSLTSVTIPDSVTSIGDSAFYWCTLLTSVTILGSVTEIGNYAFAYCDSLTSVYCKPTTPPTGSYDMFYNNASGRKIYVPAESVETYKTAEGWINYASYIVGYNF